MPNKMNWQPLYEVTAQDLLDAFGYVQQAFQDLLVDLGWHGVAENSLGAGAISVSESSPAGMTVNVGQGRAYTRQGQRLLIPAPHNNFNAMIDENDDPVTLPTAGNERYITLFAKPRYVESDSRITVAAIPFDIRSTESYELLVEASPIDAIGLTSPASPRNDAVLLCDIYLDDSVTSITDAVSPDAPVAGEIDLRRSELMDVRAKVVSASQYLRTLGNLGGSKSTPDGSRIYADLVPKAWFRVKPVGGGPPHQVVANSCNVEGYSSYLGPSTIAAIMELELPTGLFASPDDMTILVTPESSLFTNGRQSEIFVSARPLSATVVEVQCLGFHAGSVPPYPPTDPPTYGADLQQGIGFHCVIFGRPSL
jgi:hypothetical protein